MRFEIRNRSRSSTFKEYYSDLCKNYYRVYYASQRTSRIINSKDPCSVLGKNSVQEGFCKISVYIIITKSIIMSKDNINAIQAWIHLKI
jgi:hypothetical protein